MTRLYLVGRAARAFRWFVAPNADPINRACSIIAGAAVLALVATVAFVEIAR